ncbi:hypothetical protein PUNSTDRAFT_99194 [Punctularia strigosozonata HHB-11173 SS5]|uniref:uncharacterized protein n=1 Tax=Punctularia strigosozonata (strain HHB-11173) TaxID=741275 RepID=UPI000441715F|nr:uncharacterized protein PUNSTDRAFT_99194 [Punctularia strigosozonata HHB-11173 SS5]EIN11891.1 hypothetical protein PUNSTDRAFT_99194 [Punctularia strigosozonata HHB-11173 SS5]
MAAEHNFSGALATWRNIHLSELQKTLDVQGIEIVDNQKESVVGRKNLADRTKEFKKIPDEEKATAIKGLLKAYQQEVDALTKRAKSAESAFLNVYKVLAEAPDPYPLLEVAVDQAAQAAINSELQADLITLKTENADLKKRVSDFSSTESARAKAEARIQHLEQKMEDMVQEKIAQKQNELNATYDEKMRNYEQREQDLQRQLSLVKTQLRDLRASNESNQAKLLDHGQKQDQEVLTKLVELDMLVTDLEHANSRVATVERRNELLRAEIEAMRNGEERSEKVKDLEQQVSTTEKEVEQLQRLLEMQKERTENAEARLKAKTQDTEKALNEAISERDQLRSRLKQYSDYDEIKRELEIMKYVEFAGLEDVDEETSGSEEGYDVDEPATATSANGHGVRLPNPNAEKANAQRGKSLEALLAIKNKRIQEELTKLRNLHGELEASLQATQDDLQNANTELQKQRELNEKLEIDLLQMENTGKDKGKAKFEELDEQHALSGLNLGKKTMDGTVRSSPIPFTSSADTSILPIVTSQRDRFRQRNAELEEELRKQFQVISELRAEIKSLQADNLKLYEKVRYMQSYREEAASRQPAIIPTSGRGQHQPDDTSKYRTRYEESVNPFEAFRSREATRGYQSLNPLEKGVFALTRSILSHRRARTIFIFYSLSLHILIMYLMYDLSGSSDTQVVKTPNPYGR